MQKACKSCRSRQELSNEYFLAKFGVDTVENEPCKVCPLSVEDTTAKPHDGSVRSGNVGSDELMRVFKYMGFNPTEEDFDRVGESLLS